MIIWSVQPGEEKTEGRPHDTLQIPHEGKRRGRLIFCSVVTSDRTGGSQPEAVSGENYVVYVKRFLTQRVVGHWHRLSREVVTAPA